MIKLFNLMLILVLSEFLPVVSAAQTCQSESEIPASTPTGRFTVGDAAVTDSETGLMWSKCAEGLSGSDCQVGIATSHNWQAALDLASASTLDGYSDWRLPNVNELRSIVEEQCYYPAINLSVFPNTPASSFWSASPNAEYTGYAWYISFGGNASYDDRNVNLHVRLVRGGG